MRRNSCRLKLPSKSSPDEDYDSTVENLEYLTGASETDAVWALARLPILHVHPDQLIDDPEDQDAWTKVAGIRKAMQSRSFFRPVYVLHRPDDTAHPYHLIEGWHRYNAAYAEGVDLLAWVAHVDCGCDHYRDRTAPPAG